GRGRLQRVEEIDGSLGMGGSLEDGALVITQNLQPTADIGSVVWPRFKLGHDAEICTQQRRTDFGDEFLARAFGSILGIAGEITPDTISLGCPMDMLVAENSNIRSRIPKRLERRHLDMVAGRRVERPRAT